MKILLKFFILLFICTIFSCSEQNILIKEDGTAKVRISFNFSSDTTSTQDSLLAKNGLESDTLPSKELFKKFYDNKINAYPHVYQ